MPAGITGIAGMRKAHRKGAKAGARTPAPAADELVEGGIERRRIDRLPKWLLAYSRSRMTGLVQVAGSSGSHGRSRHMIARPWSARSRGKALSTRTKPSWMNCWICAWLNARAGSCWAAMKVSSYRLGNDGCRRIMFQPPAAAPSAAQEEDRSDIEDADHHDRSDLSP